MSSFLAIVKLFAKEVREEGSIPLVMIIPDRTRLDLHKGEDAFPLTQRIRDERIDVIDMGLSFGQDVMTNGPAEYYVGGVGHHSPHGNQVFARYLEKELRPWIEQAHSLSRPTKPPERMAAETGEPLTR